MTPEVTLFEVATTPRELWRLVNMRPTGRASYVAIVTASVPDGGILRGTLPPLNTDVRRCAEKHVPRLVR
jgi:hypothetical protein